jgi:hypothetical protein
VLVCLEGSSLAQVLKNTTWFVVRKERIDGSRVLQRGIVPAIKYKFTEHGFPIEVGRTIIYFDYGISNDTLRIAKGMKYLVNYFTDTLLVLTDIPLQAVPTGNEIRTFLVREPYYFQYLFQKKLLDNIGSDTLVANIYLAPTYSFLSSDLRQFRPFSRHGRLEGSFILSPPGVISNIICNPSLKAGRKDITSFRTVMYTMDYKWEMPIASLKKHFKYFYVFEWKDGGNNLAFGFRLRPQDKPSARTLSFAERKSAQIRFDAGVKLMAKEKYEKALSEFSKCIEVDSFKVEAYYDRANIYRTLHDLNKACDNWRILKDLGQKQGEILFRENCK